MTSVCPICQGELRVCTDNGIVFGECLNCGLRSALSVPDVYKEEPREVIEEDEPGILLRRNGSGVWMKAKVARRIIETAKANAIPVTRCGDIGEKGVTHESWSIEATDSEWMDLQGEAME